MMQVYSGDKLVGHIQVDMARVKVQRQYIIRMQTPLPSSWEDAAFEDEAVEVRQLALVIRRRRFRIDNRDHLLLRGQNEVDAFLRSRDVPSYADKDLDLLRDATIYSWPAFDIDKDMHEELFDLDIFEPV